MQTYPHLNRFLLGVACLGIPFFLRTVSPALEVYPSIVFPARATSVNVSSETITYNQLELYGIRDGKEFRLAPIRFLDPVPLQYLGVLFEREFGLDPEMPKRVYFKYLPLPDLLLDPGKNDAADRAETKTWLKHRLSETSCETDTLILRKRKSSVDRKTGEIAKSELLYEKSIILD